jgi:hypothetical protein
MDTFEGGSMVGRMFLGDENTTMLARSAFHTRPNQFLDIPFSVYKNVLRTAMHAWYKVHGHAKIREYRGSEMLLSDQLLAGLNSDFKFDHEHLFEDNDKFGSKIRLKADYGSGQEARYVRPGEVLTPDDFERLDLFRKEDTTGARRAFRVQRDTSEQYRGATTRRYDRSGEGFAVEASRSSHIMPIRRVDNAKFIATYDQQMRKYEQEKNKPKPLYFEREFTKI